MSQVSPLLVEEAGLGVRALTMNRAQKLNALTSELVDSLHAALDSAEMEGCRALVLTGAGRGFCSGWDLEGSDGSGLTGRSVGLGISMQRRAAALVRRIRSSPIPVIAAVNGPAVGGGFALALACDVRTAGSAAYFHPNFLRLAISNGDLGTSWLLPRAIGSSRAFEILMTGRAVDATEAERIGLASNLSEDPLAEALSMAQAIAENAPIAVQLTKEAVWAALEIPSLYAAMELENRSQVLATMTDEHAEAVEAFHHRK